MIYKAKESDWKHFSAMVPEWRERYLAGIVEGLVAGLQREEQTPTERFWDAEEKIRREVKTLRTCLDGHSRSSMFSFVVAMVGSGLMHEEDLKGFSEKLQEDVKHLVATLRGRRDENLS